VPFEIEERRIDVADLQLGMFVCRLDRPWEETPFPLQGVALTRLEDIATLQRLCHEVYIDARRLVERETPQTLTRTDLSRYRFNSSTHYTDLAAVEDEAPRARAALENASQIVDGLFEDITSGRELSVEHVEQAVRPLVTTVLRSADAFFLVEGLRRSDSYSYSHAISCSALAAAFGRHMGFDEETIFSLAAGGLLMDVGKTRLPEELLQYQGSLAPSEVDVIRSHVALGLTVLEEAGIANLDVLDIVRTHHERHDGSGYPNGLKGAQIGMMGSIAAIVDTFDALTSPRPYAQAVSPSAALSMLYKWRGTFFDAALVEQFIRCIGIFPLGCVVELNSGELAIVIGQHSGRRLQPRVMIVRDADGNPLKPQKLLDLSRGQKIATGEAYRIKRTLEYGKAGVSAEALFKA